MDSRKILLCKSESLISGRERKEIVSWINSNKTFMRWKWKFDWKKEEKEDVTSRWMARKKICWGTKLWWQKLPRYSLPCMQVIETSFNSSPCWDCWSSIQSTGNWVFLFTLQTFLDLSKQKQMMTLIIICVYFPPLLKSLKLVKDKKTLTNKCRIQNITNKKIEIIKSWSLKQFEYCGPGIKWRFLWLGLKF